MPHTPDDDDLGSVVEDVGRRMPGPRIEKGKTRWSAPQLTPAEAARLVVLENMRPRPVLDLLQDETLTSPEEVFEGLLAMGEVTVLGGPPKAMKSWTIKSMGLCAAAGGPWLGFNATRSFKVLLLSAEGREVRLRERFQKLIAFTEVEEDGLQRMEYLSTNGKLKIDTDAGERTLMRLVDPFEVVILDPIYRFIAEGDENSHADARRVQDVLDRVKEAGKCVLLVHHVRKSIGVNSGISELRGAGLDGFVDGAMMLSRTKEDSDEKFHLDFTLRNFEDPAPMELTREGVVLVPGTKAPKLLRSNIPPVEIARIIESFGGEMMGKQLYSQIKELKNVSQATAERAVAFASSPLVNMVTSRPVIGRGNGRIFSLVEDTSGGAE
ncbi:MAG: AAA family ATPase [Deltaproteobacteria bacterium]|nr:AAA family ATPase [Deltaproteobacteria bacterium]